MRKLKLFFACLLMAVLSIGQVWADPAAVGTTLFSEDFSSYAKDAVPSGSVSAATGRVVYGSGSVTYSVTNGGSTTKIYTENLAGGTSPEILVGKSNGTLVIEGIPAGGAQEITVSYKQNKQKLKVEASGTGYSGSKEEKPSASQSYSFDVTVADGAAETFTLTFTCTGSSNVRVDDILVTVKTAGEGGSTPKTLTGVTVSGTPTKTSYYEGDNFDPAGLTVTGTYSDESTAPITSGITWAYNPSQELALNQTSIGVTATVSEITSAVYPVSITVSEAPAAATYEKVTSTENITDGDYLIVYEDGNVALNGALTTLDAVGNTVAVTINEGVITGSVAIDAATVTISTTGKTIQTASGYYIGVTSYSNGLSSSTSNAYEHQNISIDGGNAVIYFQQQSWNSNKNGKMQLCYNSDSNQRRFRYFKEGSQKAIQLYKKVDGSTIKPSAELSYATADQKKLTKLGDAFTAPTLVNPHTVAVTYASDNTDVATVAANGAVTIKAAGVATITASYDGSGDYKEGSASYTIGVTSHAGTEADPYVAADVKIAIDAKGTVENAYATGVVSNVVTTTLPQDGYITFYFSADGLTSGQQVEAYKCYGLNSAPFEAVSDVVTGATVVVTGTLKKFNSTYEFDQNCHLISYTAPAAPKQSIANDQAHPYTVAQAITFAADGVTYDLDDYVYVQGVVYDVQSFNNGSMNIFIKDANAENQFELYKCAGINDGSATTPFDALSDVQAGNIVIGYGQLSYHAPYYEFKQGNYLVDLQTPATGVQLDATAEVEVGSTVNLTATILPSNATGTIVWSVESGSDKASVDAGVVTGSAEGEAVIRATVQGTEIYAECTVTVTAAPAPLTDYYEKVTETAGIVEGTYLIVYEDASVAFNGGLTTLDAESNTIDVTIVGGNKIGVTPATEAATFYLDPASGTVQAANGKYIGVSSNSNGLKTSDDATAYIHDFSIDADGNAVIAPTFEGSTMSLRYNTANNQLRFRYYKDNGQQAIQLYKLANETVKASPELTWSAESVELTVGDDFTSPTFTHADGLTESITFSSDKESVATVDANGVISLVADATGTAHITASYPGDANFKAENAVCTIKVNPAHSIYVDKLNVNFGSVTKDEAVADQKVTVTLTNVDAATATLGGTNPEAFSITPAALTASGDITISASSATAGTFAATLTISDDAGVAASKVVNLSLTVTEPEIIDDLTGTWVLATAVPAIGEKFIVAGTYNSATKTMGSQNTNNRAAVASTLAEGVLTPGEGTKVFTLVDAGEGKYAIKASNNKYLTASGTGTKNYLTEAANYDAANSKWTISVDGEGAASVVASSSNRNQMQYNKSGDGLFSCYDGGQTAIQLFVLQSAPTPTYETVRSGLEAGRHYTVCLEKNITAVKGATFWSLTFRNSESTAAYLEEVTAPEAGKPYIIQATDGNEGKLEVIYGENSETNPVANGALRGTFSGLTTTQINEIIAVDGDIYMLFNNELRPVTSGNGNYLDDHRAYVLQSALNVGTPLPAPGKRVKSMPMQPKVATGMEALDASEKPVKMVINGQLFILRGEKLYDATGRLVK